MIVKTRLFFPQFIFLLAGLLPGFAVPIQEIAATALHPVAPIVASEIPETDTIQEEELRRRHSEAIELARSGHPDEALVLLDQLRILHEQDFITNDYIAVASRLALDEKVRSFWNRIDPATTPLYVLEAVAASACRMKQYFFSQKIYLSVLQRSPDRLSALVGLHLCLAESGQIEVAEAKLKAMAKIHPRDIELQLALARLAEICGDALGEQQHYAGVLKLNPQNEVAVRALEIKARNGQLLISPDSGPVKKTVALVSDLSPHPGTPTVPTTHPGTPTVPTADSGVSDQKKGPRDRKEDEATATPENYSLILPRQRQDLIQATNLGRSGQFDEAIAIFESILAENDAAEIYYDYILVLAWAGKDEQVLRHSHQLDLAMAPDYLLEALARSGRNLEHFSQARSFYCAILERNPSHAAALRGLELVNRDEAAFRLNQQNTRLVLPDFETEAGRTTPRIPDPAYRPSEKTGTGPLLAEKAQTEQDQEAGKTVEPEQKQEINRGPLLTHPKTRPAPQRELLLAEEPQVAWAPRPDQIRSNQKKKQEASGSPKKSHGRTSENKVTTGPSKPKKQDYLPKARKARERANQRKSGDYNSGSPGNSWPQRVFSSRELEQDLSDRVRRDKARAIVMARESRFDASIKLMQELMEESKEADGVLFDYLVVLSWARKHDQVMQYIDRLPINRLPDYIASAVARSAREMQDYGLASDLYGAILRRNPADIGIKTAFWTVKAEAGYTREARDQLEILSQQEPNELEVLFSLAGIAKLEGDDSAERLYFRKILRRDSTNERARRGLRLATLSESGEVGLYDQEAVDPATMSSEAINQWHHEAVQLARDGRTNEALSLMEILLIQTDYATQLLYDYILMLSWTGESADILDFAPRINLDEAPEYVLKPLAKAARDHARFDKARQFYQAILNRNPHKIDAWVGLALCLAEDQEIARSISTLQQILFLYPESPDLVQVWSGLGYVARLDDRPSLSRYYYRKALELDPYIMEAQQALALGTPILGKTLLESTGLSPFDSESILDEAWFSVSLARQGAPGQALQNLGCIMDQKGQFPVLLYDYLQYLTWSGFHLQALAWLEELELEHLPAPVLLAMGHSARITANPDLALSLYQRALELDPAFVDARICEALTQIETGQPDPAFFTLKTLAAKYPSRSDIQTAITYARSFQSQDGNYADETERCLKALHDEAFQITLPRTTGLQAEQVLSIVLAMKKADTIAKRPALDGEEQARAVQAARQGQTTSALETLACLLDQPGRPESLLLDYVVILSWADRHQEVLAMLEVLDPATQPAFVLAAIARSARHSGDFPLAGELYRIMTDRNPEDLDAQIGILVCDAAALNDRQAYGALLNLLKDFPLHRSLLESLLPLTVKMDDVFNEIVCYQQFLKIDPGDTAAKRGLIRAVSRFGAPDLALDILEKEQVPISPVMREEILGDRAARRVGWGNIPQEKRGTVAEQQAETDLALQMLDTNLQASEPYGMARLGEWLRTQWDRLVALKQRNRLTEVVSLYQQLEPYHDRVPAFAKAAVAGAYRSLQKPQIAMVLYQEVLAAAPSFFDAEIGLYFALLEGEQLGAAMDHINTVAASEAAVYQLRGSRVRGRNPSKLSADIMSQMAIAYEDRLARAQKGIEELYFRAPHNEGLRQSLATLYRWRGWPRLALHHFEVLVGQNPENRGARTGQIYSLISLQRFDEAFNLAQEYYHQFPTEEDAQKLMRDWSLSQGYEIYTTASSFRGPGQQSADDELNLESYIYGPSLKYWWRPYAHYRYQTAEYPQGSFDYRRIGGGILFRRHDFSGSLETHADVETFDDPGLIASGSYNFNDYWSVGAEINTRSFNVSPRARLVGIDGQEYNARLSYRVSDYHRFSAGVQLLDLSDDNQRRALTLSSVHSLFIGPRWRHSGGLSLYGSRGDTRGDHPYYNPGQDLSSNLSLDSTFLTWRRYSLKFVQRLVLDYGQYQQDDYQSDWSGSLRYEHQWDLVKDLGLLYGVTRARRVYDGNPEYSTNYYLTLKWKY